MTALLFALSSLLFSVPAEAAEDGSVRNIRVECRSRIEDGNAVFCPDFRKN